MPPIFIPSIFFRSFRSHSHKSFTSKFTSTSTSTFRLHRFRPHSTLTHQLNTHTSSAKKLITGTFLTTAALIAGIVTIGGLTRLTKSGLSMTEWSLLGTKPPLNEQDWEIEFAKYKKSPEYIKTNAGMTIEQFKKIYWYEYIHRQMGRFIALAFGLPTIYLWKTGKLDRVLKQRVSAIGILIGCQGLLGWYMVKSGLETKSETPRVSPYRLSAHLSSAFFIYSITLLTALRVMRPNITYAYPKAFALSSVGLVFATAATGAFVAGLHAGHLYPTFPHMGSSWVPPDIWDPSLGIANLTENGVTVQAIHRFMATLTFGVITAFWFRCRRIPLPKTARIAIHSLMGMACVQVTLGVTTLLNGVWIWTAALHQAGSLSLLSIALWILHHAKIR